MNTARVIYHIARADFRERIRRFSFVFTLVLAVFAAYAFVPPNHVNYSTLHFAEYRGIYNSAWVGAQVAILTSMFMLMAGFFLVRNTVNRDRRSGVGQILAATPMTKPVYTVGKWLSNCAVLGAIVAALVIGAAALQLIRAEDTILRPHLLIAPFLYLLPSTVALLAALAVLFECIPFLRGGVGNVVYFFVFPQMIMSELLGGPRILGVRFILDDMRAACRLAYPEYVKGMSLGFNFHDDGRAFDLLTYTWNGMPLTADIFLNRALWILPALGIVLVAAIPFDRFDAARLQVTARRKIRKLRFQRLWRWLGQPAGAVRVEDRADRAAAMPVHLTPLEANRSHARFAGLLVANLKLALRAMPWWWHLGALGLILAEVLAPRAALHSLVLPGAWLWPILIWSPLGNREVRHATHQIVFSAAHPLRRQLSAAWLTGVIVALAIISGAAAREIAAGDWPRVFAYAVGAVFVPSLALAFGTWSRSSRLFEVLYLFWWYIGPVNAIPALDYGGALAVAGVASTTIAYAAASILLLVLGFLGGRRQLRT